MEREDVMKEIREFILEERGKYRFELKEHHSLQSDLDIYGLDAVDFILNFGKRFGVDVSGFDAEKYFRPEGYGTPNKEYPKLTIGDLLKSVDKGILL
jgi:acyl carrier protein